MIVFVSWMWDQPGYRSEFLPHYPLILEASLARHCRLEHRFLLITDRPHAVSCSSYKLWNDCSDLKNASGGHLPSCYRRLKIFDPQTTRAMGIKDGTRVVSVDLDVVVTGDVTPLFDRPEDFVGWRVPGTNHPSVYNGTLFMLRAGSHPHVWSEFDHRRSPTEAQRAGYYGSDQGWLSYVMGDTEAGWTRKDGIVKYSNECRLRQKLPSDARLVSFNGKRKPWDAISQEESPWIRNHWRM